MIRVLIVDDEAPAERIDDLERVDADDLGDVDVPLLGPLGGALAENSALMRRYADRVAERNAVLALLGRQMVAYRDLLTALSRDLEFRMAEPEIPDTDVDVPGLGTPAAIVADDEAILTGFFEGQRGRLDAAAERSHALLREIDALRLALQRGNEMLGAARAAPDDEVERLPGAVSIERLVEIDQKLLSVFYDRIGELRGLRDEVGTMQVSLAAKSVLIERLAGAIEELRVALSVLHDEAPVMPEMAEVYDCPDEHVPGLGDLRTLRNVNVDIVRGAIALVRELRGLPVEGPREESSDHGEGEGDAHVDAEHEADAGDEGEADDRNDGA